jgi:hypothetical protein
MTRHLFGFIYVLALGVMPLVGCNETTGDGGSGGIGGEGGTGGGVACADNVCPCTEAGIRAAIAEGGGRFTFDCGGPTTVVTEAEIVIDNNVFLDGEGDLTVDGDGDHTVFSVPEGVQAELDGFIVTGAVGSDGGTGNDPTFVGIANSGALTVTNSIVLGNDLGIVGNGTTVVTNSALSDNGIGIWVSNKNVAGTIVSGTATVMGSAVSNNETGIFVDGVMTLVNSTVSGSTGLGGIVGLGQGTLFMTNSTISGNGETGILHCFNRVVIRNSTIYGNVIGTDPDCGARPMRILNSIVAGCETPIDDPFDFPSDGWNIESPGDTCGFHRPDDQVNVSAEDLALGPLQDNGGPTMTHALGAGSVAIDVIPGADCEVDTDQRGLPRDSMCDVGAFEVQP